MKRFKDGFLRAMGGLMALFFLGYPALPAEAYEPTTEYGEQDDRRTEFPDWITSPGPFAEVFEDVLFPQPRLPERHRIENVEHRRPDSGEPTEPASIKIILDFHEISYDDGLPDRITVRERYPERFITPRDLMNSLKMIPVEAAAFQSMDPWADRHDHAWRVALKIIQASISLDLPVLVGYRPHQEIDTPEYTAVAVGYDRRNIELLEPFGARRPVSYDLRTFKYMFAYVMIVLPAHDPALNLPVEVMVVDPNFLNEISSTIIALPEPDPELLTRELREQGIPATLQDVNRADYRHRLGMTRSFARQGGLPLLHLVLDNGRVAVIPIEFNHRSPGFALIYGRLENNFAVVYFSSDGTFERTVATRGEIANRWLNRGDRTYHLDLISIPVEVIDVN